MEHRKTKWLGPLVALALSASLFGGGFAFAGEKVVRESQLVSTQDGLLSLEGAAAFRDEELNTLADLGRTVYVSGSNKYHFVSNCSGMIHYTEMTLRQAMDKGAVACPNCVHETPEPTPTPEPDPVPNPDPIPVPGPDSFPDPGPAPMASTERLFGETAPETAASISREAFDYADTVVIARSDDFRDALSSTAVAGCFEAPVLLTDRFSLSPVTASEIQRLGATIAYVIGGTGAIDGGIDDQLKAVGVTRVERVAGTAAWDTSVECARIVLNNGGATDKAIVAMSINFQDALSISPFAYKYKVPLFLQTDSGDRPLPAAAIDMIDPMGSSTVYVPGGWKAVERTTVESVFGAERVVRLFGESGYDTSNEIAEYMVRNGFLVADGAAFACGAPDPKGVDALAGAALAGKRGSVLLLAQANPKLGQFDTTTIEGFLVNHARFVEGVYVLGGSAVMPIALQNTIDWCLY